MPPKSSTQKKKNASNRSASQSRSVANEELSDSQQSQSILRESREAEGTDDHGAGEESQIKIDSVFKPADPPQNREDSMKCLIMGLEKKLDMMASKEFIKEQLTGIVTKEDLSETLDALKADIRNDIKEELAHVKTKCSALEGTVVGLKEEVVELQGRVSNLEDQNGKLSEHNRKLTADNKSLQTGQKEAKYELKIRAHEINNLEQYTRRNSVRIYGLHDDDPKESPTATTEKVIDMARNYLNISITPRDIDIAHRLGRFSEEGNRVIICKFVSRMTRSEVIKNRKLLKGKTIVVREDLTITNAKLLETVSSREEVKSAWSDEGRIIAFLYDDKTVTVTSKTDLSRPLGEEREKS